MAKETGHTVKTKRVAKGFTMILNSFIEDASLSWRAKGLFGYFLSKPEGWKLNVRADVVKKGKEGRDAVYNAINELVDAGYVSRTKSVTGAITYHFFENKHDNDQIDYLRCDSPDPENPDPENPDPENPDPESQDVLVIPKDSNTEYSNTEYSNDAPSVAEENSKPFIINRLIEHGVDKRLAEEYWHYRTTIKRDRPTNRAISLLINECISSNFNISKAIELTIANGWKGFKVQWVQNQQQQAGRPQQVSKREAVEAHNARIAAELIAEIQGGAQ